MTVKTAPPSSLLRPVPPEMRQLLTLLFTDPIAAITFADNLPQDIYYSEDLARLIGNWNPDNLDGMLRIARIDIADLLARL